MTDALTHSGLPEGHGRFDLLSAFEAVAKAEYGLSRTAIGLIRHYVLKTSDVDYLADRICAVWAQVCRTAQALNLSPRSINSAERELEAAGFLVRSTGANGCRMGDRTEGRITWASGANLAPLIERYRELRDKADAMRLHFRAIDRCRAEIRRINREIRRSEVAEAQAIAAELLPHGRTARIDDLARLEEIRAALSAVLVELTASARVPKTSDASEENCAPNIPPETSSKTSSCAAQPSAPAPRLTPNQAAMLATDQYRELLPVFGGMTWPAVVETSFQMALQMGIAERTWRSACDRLGREHAALCVIVIQRNAMLDAGHSYYVRKPDGCLAGMMKSTLSGAMNLAGMIAAIRGREEEQGKPREFGIEGSQDSITNGIFRQMAARYGRCTRLS